MKTLERALAALLAAVTLSSGCELDETPDASEMMDELPVAENDGLAAQELTEELADALEPAAVSNGWTYYTSEEQMPVGCYAGSAVAGVQCRGSYCDNIRLNCSPTGNGSGGSTWSPYFSEEQSEYVCPDRHWMTAIGCKGSYCDNISLRCTEFPAASPNSCYWTGWISEEGGGRLLFGAGYFARGAVCRGSYCDNKRFYVCKM